MIAALRRWWKRPSGNRRRRPPFSEGLITRLRWLERWFVWLLGLGFALAGIVALLSWSHDDPAWSTTGARAAPRNLLGVPGAWFADLGLSWMGASVAWPIVFLLTRLLAHRPPWRAGDMTEQPAAARAAAPGTSVGFLGAWWPLWLVLLIVASAALEALGFGRRLSWLPQGAGGILGQSLATPLIQAVGFAPALLGALCAFVASLTLVFRLPWLVWSEAIGSFLLDGPRRWFEARERAREVERDQAAAASVVAEREAYVAAQARRVGEHDPIRIVEPVQPIELSERVEREKQTPLFAELPDTVLPPLSLLEPVPKDQPTVSAETLEFTSRLIERKLSEFNVPVKVLAAYPGPVITRYEIEPDVGVKGSAIVNLAKDLARAMSVASIRVVETIPGKSCMGLEVPNPQRQTVGLIEILGSAVYNDSPSVLTLGLGKDISGRPVVADLAKMPHCLVAGTTGSGKSVGINQMILSLLYRAEPKQVRLVLIDPKMLELSIYEGIPHLLCPVVTDMKLAANALHWCVGEMERRYKLLSATGVRQLSSFNAKVREARERGQPINNPLSLTPENPEPLEELPFIVVVIDELADLMMVAGKKIEELIARLAQKARAAGIHLILATQRPSVDVITGLIKANVPTRIAFQVASKIDSRTILDQMGAEALLGRGDMLYLAGGTGVPVRVHGAFVADEEVHRVVEHWKAQAPVQYVEGVLEGTDSETLNEVRGAGSNDAEKDPRYDEAVAIVLESRQPSISYLQRRMRIGYNGAARLIEAMEAAGIVSKPNAMGKREVLVPGGSQR
ncbi:MAG: DNA translocase FtsK 4TM domain-containing protein [Casimicrobiaceae bacterium]|nr:DNA translocase FtsK 4TM domain-containing protein [Casimicrobiaceae bacterium]MDW8312545.1 DNA translocase FtsK 4TM domain-containing protein [Burkholderiales bacterium]